MSKSAAAFKRAETVTLPKSGLEVELCKPNVARIMMKKENLAHLPASLQNQLQQSINGKTTDLGAATLGIEDLPGFADFMDMIVRGAFVWPEVVDSHPDYDAGQIALTDLEPEDFQYVYNWAMPGEAQAASRFHPESNGSLESPQPQ